MAQVTKEQLLAVINNPNARAMLDYISAAEGTDKYGYRTQVFNQKPLEDLSSHPSQVITRSLKHKDGVVRDVGSSAAGRYQMIKGTWDNQAKKLDLKDFSGMNQDLAALGLIADKGALNDVLQGNFKRAINKLGSTWAALPSNTSKQNNRSIEHFNNFFSHVGNDYIPSAPGIHSGYAEYAKRSNKNGNNPIVPSDNKELIAMDTAHKVDLNKNPELVNVLQAFKSTVQEPAVAEAKEEDPVDPLAILNGAITPWSNKQTQETVSLQTEVPDEVIAEFDERNRDAIRDQALASIFDRPQRGYVVPEVEKYIDTIVRSNQKQTA